MKHFLLLILILINISTKASLNVKASVPFTKGFTLLLNYINKQETLTPELHNSLKNFNRKVSYSDTGEDFHTPNALLIDAHLHKWLLKHSKKIPYQNESHIPELEKQSADTFRKWIVQSIKNDFDQMKILNAKKKLIYSQLTPGQRKMTKLLLPWLKLTKNASEFNDYVLSHLPSFFTDATNLLTIQNEVLNYKANTKLALTFNKHQEKNSSNNSTKSVLPIPTNEWTDQNIYRKNKSNEKDSRGLPVPVDDWIFSL